MRADGEEVNAGLASSAFKSIESLSSTSTIDRLRSVPCPTFSLPSVDSPQSAPRCFRRLLALLRESIDWRAAHSSRHQDVNHFYHLPPCQTVAAECLPSSFLRERKLEVETSYRLMKMSICRTLPLPRCLADARARYQERVSLALLLLRESKSR